MVHQNPYEGVKHLITMAPTTLMVPSFTPLKKAKYAKALWDAMLRPNKEEGDPVEITGVFLAFAQSILSTH